MLSNIQRPSHLSAPASNQEPTEQLCTSRENSPDYPPFCVVYSVSVLIRGWVSFFMMYYFFPMHSVLICYLKYKFTVTIFYVYRCMGMCTWIPIPYKYSTSIILLPSLLPLETEHIFHGRSEALGHFHW